MRKPTEGEIHDASMEVKLDKILEPRFKDPFYPDDLREQDDRDENDERDGEE